MKPVRLNNNSNVKHQKNTKQTNNVNFASKPDTLEKVPQQDEIQLSAEKKKKKTNFKIILGITLAATAITSIVLTIKKGKVQELSFDEFKKIGGKFEKGKAIKKNGKPFNGKLLKETSKGDKFVVEYKNDLMQKSTKNFSDLVDEYSTKEYSYSEGGKLKEVTEKRFKIDKTAKTFYLEMDEKRKALVNKNLLYQEQVTSKTKYDDKKIETFITDFAKTAEGKRRAQMSDEEIEKEVQELFNKALSKKGIDKSVAPKVKIVPNENIAHGGSYDQKTNVLELNPNSFRTGVFSLEDVTMHEVTHFEEALLRSRLDNDTATQIVKNKLASRIFEGEADEVIVSGGFMGPKTIKTPKLSEKMKKEFKEFATNSLYTNNKDFQKDILALSNNKGKASNEAQKEILSNITKLIDDNPDFISQYSSKEEAIEMLTNYSASHNTRFLTMTSESKIDTSKLPKLTPEEEKRALDSLDRFLETMEGNARISGFKFFGITQEEFNNYQFSREEVLAQKEGNTFAIKEIKAKIEQMKKDGTLTPQLEAYYNYAINKSQLTIEYKTKGQAWYQKYIQSLNNPNNKALKESVQEEWEELSKIQEKIKDPLIPTGVWERIKK